MKAQSRTLFVITLAVAADALFVRELNALVAYRWTGQGKALTEGETKTS